MAEILMPLEGPGLFHDFEVGGIQVDYRRHQAVIWLKSLPPEADWHALRLFGLRHFRMDFTEPWGKGFYTASCDIGTGSGGKRMELTLNSGDALWAEFQEAALYPGGEAGESAVGQDSP